MKILSQSYVLKQYENKFKKFYPLISAEGEVLFICLANSFPPSFLYVVPKIGKMLFYLLGGIKNFIIGLTANNFIVIQVSDFDFSRVVKKEIYLISDIEDVVIIGEEADYITQLEVILKSGTKLKFKEIPKNWAHSLIYKLHELEVFKK